MNSSSCKKFRNLKNDEDIVAEKNAELTKVDRPVRVNEEGCTAYQHGNREVPWDDVVFICQMMWE